MRNTFLSIDLDYWYRASHARKFLEELLTSKIPIILVERHDLLIPYVNRAGRTCDTLVNIDFHDDLTGPVPPGRKLPALDEGTWVSHVSWAKRGRYLWCYPGPRALVYGLCDWDDDVWVHNTSPWRLIRRHRGILFDIEAVRYIGISFSPNWWRGSPKTLESLRTWLEERWGRRVSTLE